MSFILVAVLVLGGIGVLGAIILYFVAHKFHVDEDPQIELVEQLLPGANCGGCGRSGCHDFATACVLASSLDGLRCPAAGDVVMAEIAKIKGVTSTATTPMVAVIKCNGTCENRPVTSQYDGAESCAILHSVYAGVSDCSYGCLGEGDCVDACRFDAITIDPTTGMPRVNDDACTACGVCVKACPRNLIELRAKGPRGMRVWVACANQERGALALKECKVSCIGCAKCVKTCTHEAIKVENNLAYIDYNKCRLCRKCVDVCPTHAINAVNFPLKKVVVKQDNQE